jgi:branched-chain amino acid transport system ATP-binding protein
MSFVMSVCDELVVLDFGRQIAQGSPETVRNDRAVIAAYLGEEESAVAATDGTPPHPVGTTAEEGRQ